jgi:hypothetical protein
MFRRIQKRLRRLDVERSRQLGIIALRVSAIVIVFLILVAVVKVSSGWLAATGGIADAAKRAEEVGRARTAVLALLAGGLAVVGAYYTHLSFGLNRQGQITERFTRAVDQLGHDSPDVRLGGIYALERIARESHRDHGPIVEILTAYVRERAPMIDTEEEERRYDYAPDEYPMPPSVDVQAALTVLGRRNTAFDPPLPWRLDLARAYLPRARLENANLRGANLAYAVLDDASLVMAALDGAILTGARLREVDLTAAQLVGVDLGGARLYNANMAFARLRKAKMMNVRLDGAFLTNAFLQDAALDKASLKGAHLIAANLEGACLLGANLEDTRYSKETVWPDGFDVEGSGAVLVEGD